MALARKGVARLVDCRRCGGVVAMHRQITGNS